MWFARLVSEWLDGLVVRCCREIRRATLLVIPSMNQTSVCDVRMGRPGLYSSKQDSQAPVAVESFYLELRENGPGCWKRQQIPVRPGVDSYHANSMP